MHVWHVRRRIVLYVVTQSSGPRICSRISSRYLLPDGQCIIALISFELVLGRLVLVVVAWVVWFKYLVYLRFRRLFCSYDDYVVAFIANVAVAVAAGR